MFDSMDCFLTYNLSCINGSIYLNSSSILDANNIDTNNNNIDDQTTRNILTIQQDTNVLVSIQHCILTTIILGGIILATITGNIFVIAAVFLEKSLHSVAYYLIVSLAAADLMVASMVMPIALLKEITRSWILGSFICDAWIFIDLLCCTASILHLVAIALDRYWAITNIDYGTKRTPTRIIISITIIWCTSILISSAHLFPIFRDKKGRPYDQCHLIGTIPYTILSTIGAFYIPLIVMCIIYWKIFQAAKFRIRKKAFTSRPAPPLIQTADTGINNNNNHHHHRKLSIRFHKKQTKKSLENHQHSDIENEQVSTYSSSHDQPSIITTPNCNNNDNKVQRHQQHDGDCQRSTSPSPTPLAKASYYLLNRKKRSKQIITKTTAFSQLNNPQQFVTTTYNAPPHTPPTTPSSPLLNIHNPNAIQISTTNRLLNYYSSPTLSQKLFNTIDNNNDDEDDDDIHQLNTPIQSVSSTRRLLKKNNIYDNRNISLCEKVSFNVAETELLTPAFHIHNNNVSESLTSVLSTINSSGTPTTQIQFKEIPQTNLSASVDSHINETPKILLTHQTDNTSIIPSKPKHPVRKKIDIKRERKASKVLGVVMGCFIVCWLPFFIEELAMGLFHFTINEKFISVLTWLGYLNSLLNPVIYTIFSPDFRQAFAKILFGKYRKRRNIK